MTNLLAAAILISVTFTSCKKDHTCTCTYQDTKTGQFATQATTINGTKNKANGKCTEYGNYLQSIGAFNINCGL